MRTWLACFGLAFLLTPSLASAEPLTLCPTGTSKSRYCYVNLTGNVVQTLYQVDPSVSPYDFTGYVAFVTVTLRGVELTIPTYYSAPQGPCYYYLFYDNTFDDCTPNNLMPPIPVAAKSVTYGTPNGNIVATIYEGTFVGVDGNADGTYDYSRAIPQLPAVIFENPGV